MTASSAPLVVLLLVALFAAAFGAEHAIPITYYSIIKLKHQSTKHYLHSHEVQYGTGSGQQSVTCVNTASDVNSYWTVMPQFHSEEKPVSPGSPVANGDTIRLQHVTTHKFLHSHKHRSPLTSQQEVSCLEPLNTGDDWRLHILSAKKHWIKGDPVSLEHVDTGMYLHSHKHTFGNPIPGQQEVTAFRKGDSQNLWSAQEGIYLTEDQD